MRSVAFVFLVALLGSALAVPCNDGTQCPDGSSCCVLANGAAGCCFDNELNNVDPVIARELFLGVLEGVIEGEVPQVATCIKDSSSIVQDIKGAIEAFEQKDFDSVKKGLSLLGDAIDRLPTAMRDCKASDKDIEKVKGLIATLRNPASLIYNMGKNLLLNGREIFGEINAAIDAYHTQKWHEMGRQIGLAFAKLLSTDQITEIYNGVNIIEAPLAIQRKAAFEILEGVIIGVAVTEIPDIAVCGADVDKVIHNIAAAVASMEAQTPEGIKEGLTKIADALEVLPTILKDCKKAEAEAEKVYQLLSTLHNPMEFAYHVGKNLLVNGRNIFEEINLAIDDYVAQNWKAMGKDIGTALAKLLVGNVQSVSPVSVKFDKDIAVEILKGVLQQLAVSEVDKFAPCLSDSQGILSDIGEAVAELKKKTRDSVVSGLRLFANAVSRLPEAIKECGGDIKSSDKIQHVVELLKNPKSLVYTAGKNLLVNGQDIFHDINAAVDSYHNQEWRAMGQAIGKALDALLLGEIDSLRQVAASGSLSQTDKVITPMMVAQINTGRNTWTATLHDRFAQMTIEEMRALTGTILGQISAPVADFSHLLQYVQVPDSFDAREKWPKCVLPIRDQKKCGSCWAFGATEALADRFCIASNGAVSEVLSPQDMVSCDQADLGCQGGYLDRAWNYLEEEGVVSEQCFPYSSAAGEVESCLTGNHCKSSSVAFKKFKVKYGTTRFYSNEASIQMAIMTNGPVESGFQVYRDFPTYKSGIYQRTSSELLGGHAIKIIGWGVENGVKYWTVANSWSTTWGEQGFFRIRRGTNECDIEGNAIAGLPDL